MFIKTSANFSYFEELIELFIILLKGLLKIIGVIMGFATICGLVCFFVFLIFIPFELILFKIKKGDSTDRLKHMAYIAPISAVITVILVIFFLN